MTTLTLKNPLDMHLHLREGEVLASVLPYTARAFLGAVVMPNLSTPITTAALAQNYRDTITSLESSFNPIMTIYLSDSLDIAELKRIKEMGFKILKLYPKGATTNSSNGISDALSPQVLTLLEEAQNLGFILSIHGESAGFSMDREYEFLSVFDFLARRFPRLKIILEHMSDHRSITLLENFENIFATLTLHHITMDLDDLLGKGLNPHHFCKPIIKTPKDREKLLELALCAHPKVSFGSDSAPHPQKSKLTHSAAAGIFSAPHILERLAELFEEHGALENLQAFISDNALKNYDLTFPNEKHITLVKKPCTIPQSIAIDGDCIIPLCGGRNVSWSVSE